MSRNRNRNARVPAPEPTEEQSLEEIAAAIGPADVEVSESEPAGQVLPDLTATAEAELPTITTKAAPLVVNPIVADGWEYERLMTEHKNFSGVMKFLGAKGYETKHIAKFMNKRYQHVRNVLIQPARKAS